MAMSVKTTGIGSLPYSNIDDAIEYSLKHDLPFFPQLLKIHGNMISQLKNFNFDHIDEFVDKSISAGHSRVKIQIAGPNTSLQDKSLYFDTIEKLTYLLEKIEIIFFIDEPILEEVSCLKEIINKLHQSKFETALHCCNVLTPERIALINSLELDYFSYDAILNPDIENKLKCEQIIFGCISTQTNEYISPKSTKISHLSATCGLALSERDPEEVLTQLDNLRDNF